MTATPKTTTTQILTLAILLATAIPASAIVPAASLLGGSAFRCAAGTCAYCQATSDIPKCAACINTQLIDGTCSKVPIQIKNCLVSTQPGACAGCNRGFYLTASQTACQPIDQEKFPHCIALIGDGSKCGACDDTHFLMSVSGYSYCT